MPSISLLCRDPFSVDFLWKRSALVLLLLLGGSHANLVKCSICEQDEIAFPDQELVRFQPPEVDCFSSFCPCEEIYYASPLGICTDLERAGFWDPDEPVTITSATCQDLQDALDTITIPWVDCSSYHLFLNEFCCEKVREKPIREDLFQFRYSNYPLIEIIGYFWLKIDDFLNTFFY